MIKKKKLSLKEARRLGEVAGQACTENAKLDQEAAKDAAIAFIRTEGRVSGEELIDALKQQGFTAHDDRAFGSVVGALVRRKQIRCVGYVARVKGHGTAGGRIWEAVVDSGAGA